MDVILQQPHSTATFLRGHREWAVPAHGKGGWSFSKWEEDGRRNLYTICWEKGWAERVWLSPLEEERREDADQVGKYRTESFFGGIMLQVAVTLLSFRVCFTQNHMSSHASYDEVQASIHLARKRRVWADCPNTFRKDLLIKTLLCGSIFRCTS